MPRVRMAAVRLVPAIVLAVSALALAVDAATGAGRAGADFRVNQSTSAGVEQSMPAVAWNDTANQFLVVWEDGRAAGQSDIYGRLVSRSGIPVGADRLISGASAVGPDRTPAVAWNAEENQYLVVWADVRDATTRGTDVYGRLVGASGAPLGGNFRISGPAATGNETSPAVTWNGTRNEYLVVWADDREWAYHPGDIYGRRLAADGKRQGGEIQVTASAWDIAQEPAVAWNASRNEYLVVWEDWRNIFDIYGRRLGAAGTPFGADIRISGTGAEAFSPALVWNADANQYVVVWEDARNEDAGRGVDIYGRRVGPRGGLLGAERRFSGGGAVDDDVDPAVGYSTTSNRYLVVWEDYRNFAQNETEIYGRRMSSGGALAAGDFRISDSGATLDKEAPALAWNDDADRYLVAWGDDRDFFTSFWDVYARLASG